MTPTNKDPNQNAGTTQDDQSEGHQQQDDQNNQTPPEQKQLTEDDIKKLLQKEGDRIRTEYAKKLKDLEAEKERLEQEKMSEDEKREHQLKKLQSELAAKEQALRDRELEHHAIGVLQQQKLPLEFVPFVRGSSEDDTNTRVETFKAAWQAAIQAAVDDRFRGTGGDPARSQDTSHGEPNPWKKESFNLTKQGEILRTDPTKAAKMKAAAGAR